MPPVNVRWFSRSRTGCRESRDADTFKNCAATPAPQHVGLWCGLYALAPQLAGIGQAALQCVARFQTRQRYGIRGNVVEDTLIGTFCTTCSLVQEARELDDEEEALRQSGPAPDTFFHDDEAEIRRNDEESQIVGA